MLLAARLYGFRCRRRGGGETEDPNEVIDVTASTEIYLMGSGEGVPVTVEFRNGTTITALIPEEDITIPSGETGAMTVNVSYMGKTVAVNIFVSPSAPGTDPEEDPALINSETKLKNFINGSAGIKEAIITGSFEANLTGEDGAYTNSDSHLYSTSPDNTVVLTGEISGQTKFFVSADNVVIEGFTFKDGTDTNLPLLKVSNKDETNQNNSESWVKNVILKDMRFETNLRGVEFHGTSDCKVENCIITKASRFYGELQIRRSAGLNVDGLTVEGESGSVAFNYGSNPEPLSTETTFTNLINVGSITAENSNIEITTSNPEYEKSIIFNYGIWAPME